MAKKMKKGEGVKKYLDGGDIAQEPTITTAGQEPVLKKPVKKPTKPNQQVLTPQEIQKRSALTYNPDVFRAEIAKRDKLKLDGKGYSKVPGVISDNAIPLVDYLGNANTVVADLYDKNGGKELTYQQVDDALKAAKQGDAKQFFSYVDDYNAYRGVTPKEGVAPTIKQTISSDYDPVMGGGYKAVQQPVYDENLRNLFVKPEGKAKGGKVGKGVKGYLAGGDIREDQPVVGEKKRSYGTKPLDYVHDTGLAIADYTVGHVSPNLIKDKDYKTKTGAQANQVSYGVNKIGGAIGQGIVDYYIPGLGTAIGAGRGAVGGEDKGLNEKDTAKQNAVAGKIGIAGQMIAGGATAMNKKKAAEEPTMTNAGAEPTFEEQVDNDINAGTFEQTDTSNLGYYDGKNLDKELTPQQKLEWVNLDANDKADYVANGFKLNGGMAKGGEIKGKGTGTSDSIPAKLEDGGFIVPAKNAAIAEGLRKKYLGENKTASLSKGDTNVKVSNGEHYFTQDEADLLRAKGVDLDSLAPDAEDSNEMATGGSVGDDKKELEAAKKKKVLELQNEIIEAQAEIKSVGSDRGNYASGLIKNAKARIANAEKASRKAMQDDAYVKQDIGRGYIYSESKAEKLSEDFKKKPVASGEKIDVPAYGSIKSDPILDRAQPEGKASKPYVANAKGGKAGSGIQRSLAVEPIQKIDGANLDNYYKTQQAVTEAQVKEGEAPTGIAQTPAALKLQEDIASGKGATAPTRTGSGISKGFGVGDAFSLYQVGQGLKSLNDSGSRPIDQIDADFAATVERAKTDALSGMSPIERSVAERNIERTRRAGIQSIVGLSGGSAGTALANIGAAGLRADESNLNLSAASEALRLQKQAYADNLVGKKAGMSRQLFEDKMNAFNQNQMAGAQLLGTGIQNVIGERRYQKELNAQEEAKRMGNYQYIS